MADREKENGVNWSRLYKAVKGRKQRRVLAMAHILYLKIRYENWLSKEQ